MVPIWRAGRAVEVRGANGTIRRAVVRGQALVRQVGLVVRVVRLLVLRVDPGVLR